MSIKADDSGVRRYDRVEWSPHDSECSFPEGSSNHGSLYPGKGPSTLGISPTVADPTGPSRGLYADRRRTPTNTSPMPPIWGRLTRSFSITRPSSTVTT